MASESDAGKQVDSLQEGEKSLPPRLPSEASANASLAGLRTHRLNLLAGLPRPEAQCPFRLSYLLTAAGQFRILTGFPFHPPGVEPRNWTTISREEWKCNTTCCEYLGGTKKCTRAESAFARARRPHGKEQKNPRERRPAAKAWEHGLCKMRMCRSGSFEEPVKREAGEIPALSRSGDGNETLHGLKPARCLNRDGKRQRSREPKVRRPACRHHHGSAGR
jgi:hypothetical protein